MTTCVITLDHPNDIYTSGESVNGHVKLQTDKTKSVRSISIKIVGYAKVLWREQHGKSSTSYKAHQQYLNSVNNVLGSPDGDSFDLQPGIYEYTFTCDLPTQLPSSMIEEFGKIKYKIIVTIDRRLRFDNVFKKEFIVHHILDLNQNPNNRLPWKNTGRCEIAPFFGCCCLNGTIIKAELKIPCGGYVPGQKIPFQLIIYNESNIDLSSAKVKLMKCYTYHSVEPCEKDKEQLEMLGCKNFDTVIPRQTNKELKFVIPVPYVVPTYRTQFIDVAYKLQAKIRVFGYNRRKFCFDIPVNIGSIAVAGFDPDQITFDF